MEIIHPPLRIVRYPHPSLRHAARPLAMIDRKVRLVAEAMLELMYEQRGLGLAAPQVGLPFRLFVANYAGDRAQPDKQGVYLNPVIMERRGSMEGEEGCLSFPGLYQKVRRARSVTVQAYTLEGQLVELHISELPSRIWQHEVDHLDGVLFIDKLGPIGKLAARGSLREFEYEHRKAQDKGEIAATADIESRLAELDAQGPDGLEVREVGEGPPPI
jgi:peptide deformylase